MLIVGPDPDYYNQMYQRIGNSLSVLAQMQRDRARREEEQYQYSLRMMADQPELAVGPWGDKFLAKYGGDRPEAGALVNLLRKKQAEADAEKALVGGVFDRAKTLQSQFDAIPDTVTQRNAPVPAGPDTGEPQNFFSQPPMGAQADAAALANQYTPSIPAVSNAAPETFATMNPMKRQARLAALTGGDSYWRAVNELPGEEQLKFWQYLDTHKDIPRPNGPQRLDINKMPAQEIGAAVAHGLDSPELSAAADVVAGISPSANTLTQQAGAAERARQTAEGKTSAAALADQRATERIKLQDRLRRGQIELAATLKAQGKTGAGNLDLERKIKQADVNSAVRNIWGDYLTDPKYPKTPAQTKAEAAASDQEAATGARTVPIPPNVERQDAQAIARTGLKVALAHQDKIKDPVKFQEDLRDQYLKFLSDYLADEKRKLGPTSSYSDRMAAEARARQRARGEILNGLYSQLPGQDTTTAPAP